MTIIGRCYLDPITQEVFLTRPALSFSLASMECFLSLFSVQSPKLETIYQYFLFNYLQPNQDWWQGYLSAGRNHDTPPSFRLLCLSILKSPSQASKSSKTGQQSSLHSFGPRMVAGAGPGYHWRRIPSPACAASLHNGPQCPCARSRLAYTPNIYQIYLPDICQIFTPYFATNHSSFFNFFLTHCTTARNAHVHVPG